MPSKKALNCYHDWLEPLRKISEKDFKKFFIAMMEYDIYGTPPPKFKGSAEMAASFIFPQIERAKKYSEAQKKGDPEEHTKVDQRLTKGEPKVEQRLTNGLVYTDTYTETKTNTVTVTEKKNKKKNPGEEKECYGEYGNVYLSDDDICKLKDEFPNDYFERIDALSRYMECTGKRYKNHLATIQTWARRDAARQDSSVTDARSSTFDIDEFWDAAVKHSLGDN